MKTGYRLKQRLFALVIVFVFLLDRVSKFLIMKGMPFWGKISGKFFSFVMVHNAGAAFGMLQGQRFFLIAFSIFAIVFIGYYVLKRQDVLNTAQVLGLGMLCGGTAGNLFDRVGYGYVVDFIRLNFIEFPVFNVADVFINIGVALVIIGLLKQKTPKSGHHC